MAFSLTWLPKVLKDAGLKVPDEDYLRAAVALEQERVKKLSDFPDALRFFLVEEVEPGMKFLVKKKGTEEETAAALSTVFELVQDPQAAVAARP